MRRRQPLRMRAVAFFFCKQTKRYKIKDTFADESMSIYGLVQFVRVNN
ncbi:hypothetical protein Barb4_04737 [Bacteroidales bacterium Barb4]|nr:hypothetical protein Barb4_04737 [Bacteroidales bacterium Barb4]